MNRITLDPTTKVGDDLRDDPVARTLPLHERLKLARDLAALEQQATEKRIALKGCDHFPMSSGTVDELAHIIYELQKAGMGSSVVSLNIVNHGWRSFPGQPRTTQNRPNLRGIRVEIVDQDDEEDFDLSDAARGVQLVLTNTLPAAPIKPKPAGSKKRPYPINVADDEDDSDDE